MPTTLTVLSLTLLGSALTLGGLLGDTPTAGLCTRLGLLALGLTALRLDPSTFRD